MLRAKKSVRKFIEVEHCAEQHYHREDNHDAAHHAVDEHDAVVVEFAPHLVYEPRQAEPPQHGADDDADVANGHLERAVVHHEGKLGKEEDKEEDDERIGQRYKECRHTIVHERAFLVFSALMNILCGVRPITIYTEEQQNHTATNLKQEAVALIADKIHDETHAETSEQRIYEVANTSTDASNKPIPAPLVKRALYAKHPHRPHRSRCHDADKYSLEYEL